jgi:hypothetical protein
MIRFFTWALAAVFLVETVAAFTWSREHEWWLYGPVSLMLGSARVGRGGLGRSVANPPATPDTALALTP